MSRELFDTSGEIPATLRERMLEALESVRRDDAGATPAVVLADAALDRLRLVLDSAGDRGVALELLAADALLTEACAAAAGVGTALDDFTSQLLDRLAALLPA